MQEHNASRTALGTAYLRAAHQILDPAPHLFEDPVALRILGASAAERIRKDGASYATAQSLALRSSVCLRSRFTEDNLAKIAQTGPCTYIQLGAGFDSFAWRQPEWAVNLPIIEIDHPATQGLKREMLARAGLAEPENLHFIAADFDRENISDVLIRAGLTAEKRVYFAWLGVSMYLAASAVTACLHAMASFAPGSAASITFRQPPDPEEGPDALAHQVATLGEPFVTYYTPAQMAAELAGAGFNRMTFLSPQIASASYYSHGHSHLPPPDKTSIVLAEI